MDQIRAKELATAMQDKIVPVLEGAIQADAVREFLSANSQILARYDSLIHASPEARGEPAQAMYEGGLREFFENARVPIEIQHAVINPLAGVEVVRMVRS